MPPPGLIGDHSGTTMRNNPVARSAVIFASRVHFVFEKTKLKSFMCFFRFRPYCYSQRDYVISKASFPHGIQPGTFRCSRLHWLQLHSCSFNSRLRLPSSSCWCRCRSIRPRWHRQCQGRSWWRWKHAKGE